MRALLLGSVALSLLVSGCGPDPYSRGVLVGALNVRTVGWGSDVAGVASVQDALRQVRIGREEYINAWGGEPRRHEVVVHSIDVDCGAPANGCLEREDSPTRIGDGGGPRVIHIRYGAPGNVASLTVHELSHDHLDDLHQDPRWATIQGPAASEAKRRALKGDYETQPD